MAEFAKYQALGNDYLLIDPASAAVPRTAEAARALCDRRFGVGADGVMFGPLGGVTAGEPVAVQIFNADGTECERSANGLRLFALYLAEHYEPRDHYVLRTVAGESAVDILDRERGLIRIGMGVPSYDPAVIGVLGVTQALAFPLKAGRSEYTVTALHNGNPHAVVLLDEASEALAREAGPLIAGHERFPSRVNVSFARVADRHTIDLFVYERGAGYTPASGACACATAAAARSLGFIEDTVTVRMPGGELEISIAADGAVSMTGVTALVCTGQLAPALRSALGGGS
ncbi:diaminopimelate epimerase [Longispora albida]|uniref:diaminopimelate epimerase n=1 Tax=Longispora albida TaxID=203523 RepID=UPI00037D8FA2|nr:diaminopimelate epimerase [Longispora albida]